MTNAEVKALSEVLTYVSRMVVDIRIDTQAIRKVASRQAQQVRRLREANAKLRAELRAVQNELKEFHKFTDPI